LLRVSFALLPYTTLFRSVNQPVPVRAVPAPPALHVVPELLVSLQRPQPGLVDLVQELAHLYAVPGLQPPETVLVLPQGRLNAPLDRKSTRLNSSHVKISY